MKILLLASLAMQPAGGSIDGRWINPDRSVIIEIAPCGEQRCGTVTWASDKAKADAAKGAPQLIGTQLLSGLVLNGGGAWHGRLFVPDRNIKAKAKLVLNGPNQIRVSGCSLALFCKSQLWTRDDQRPGN